jgi:hypothetical protein
MMIVQHHEGEHLLKRAIDQFDRLYLEGKQRQDHGASHPSLHQRPAAPIKYLKAIYEYAARFEGVLHWNGLEILEWYQETQRYGPDAVPGYRNSGFIWEIAMPRGHRGGNLVTLVQKPTAFRLF